MPVDPIDRRPSSLKSPYRNGLIGGATVTVGTEAADAINVTIQLQDQNLANLGQVAAVHAYLSDNADGSSIAASAPTGGWAIGTDGLLIPIVANKAALLVSEADGDIDITITESSAKTFYLVLVLPDGSLDITAVTFA